MQEPEEKLSMTLPKGHSSSENDSKGLVNNLEEEDTESLTEKDVTPSNLEETKNVEVDLNETYVESTMTNEAIILVNNVTENAKENESIADEENDAPTNDINFNSIISDDENGDKIIVMQIEPVAENFDPQNPNDSMTSTVKKSIIDLKMGHVPRNEKLNKKSIEEGSKSSETTKTDAKSNKNIEVFVQTKVNETKVKSPKESSSATQSSRIQNEAVEVVTTPATFATVNNENVNAKKKGEMNEGVGGNSSVETLLKVVNDNLSAMKQNTATVNSLAKIDASKDSNDEENENMQIEMQVLTTSFSDVSNDDYENHEENAKETLAIDGMEKKSESVKTSRRYDDDDNGMDIATSKDVDTSKGNEKHETNAKVFKIVVEDVEGSKSKMASLQSPKRPLENRISSQEFAVRKKSSIHSPAASKFKEATVDSLSISTTSNSMTTSSSLETTLESLNVGFASDDERLRHSFTSPPSPRTSSSKTSSSSFPSTTTSSLITSTTKASGFQGWRYKLQSILRRKKDSSKSPSTKLQPSKKAAEMRTNNVVEKGSTSSTPPVSFPNIQEPLKDNRGKNKHFYNETFFNLFNDYSSNFAFSFLEAPKFSAGLVKLISVSHPITVCAFPSANPKEGGKNIKSNIL